MARPAVLRSQPSENLPTTSTVEMPSAFSHSRRAGRVRKGLYFPAIAAIRFNPSLQPLARRLRGAGKPPMLIIGAAMRKLIHLAFGVLKSGRAYDSTG